MKPKHSLKELAAHGLLMALLTLRLGMALSDMHWLETYAVVDKEPPSGSAHDWLVEVLDDGGASTTEAYQSLTTKAYPTLSHDVQGHGVEEYN
ncbi:hypothetical protein BDD12DRAFT_890582 [Trichophaea hybrida]|nr:hypothetical protein BDD12DRAFT_890582 [Trichophaea hybrida]